MLVRENIGSCGRPEASIWLRYLGFAISKYGGTLKCLAYESLRLVKFAG